MKNLSDNCQWFNPEIPFASQLKSEEVKTKVVITHIELFNFKSFAGKQVVGQFDERISVIAGPNGAGKSNLLDSLVFVLGNDS